ncbi:hypothetical protein GP486_006225 [Trichoglossum hirsutum]|uniref:Uncharacterized protein n=1 Tax=Trichoglossum hirsutum TaxID=265104 RepID=A0A9P8I8I0_9PEZI|nr:hypothetical protein GP486_006225 [Trichoglossum hirsutum]
MALTNHLLRCREDFTPSYSDARPNNANQHGSGDNGRRRTACIPMPGHVVNRDTQCWALTAKKTGNHDRLIYGSMQISGHVTIVLDLGISSSLDCRTNIYTHHDPDVTDLRRKSRTCEKRLDRTGGHRPRIPQTSIGKTAIARYRSGQYAVAHWP